MYVISVEWCPKRGKGGIIGHTNISSYIMLSLSALSVLELSLITQFADKQLYVRFGLI